jgi:stage II sporulation protein AA (anti-sigma F factor antagonist)
MSVAFESINNKLVIRINGDIDHHTCESIRQRIDNEIEKKNSKNLIFDMENVGFMDSSGVGVIIGRYKQVSSKGGVTVMINVKPQIKRVYEICGLQRIIQAYENLEQAVKNIS